MITAAVTFASFLVFSLVLLKIHRDSLAELDRLNTKWADRVEKERTLLRQEREDLLNRLMAFADKEAAATVASLQSGPSFEVSYVNTEHEGRGGYLNGSQD